MREIKEMAEFIDDEVEGVLGYAKAAVFYKETRPTLATMYYKIASTEYQHVQMLHTEVANLIKEAENKMVDPPPEMRDKWDKQHKAAIKKMAEAKTYLAMFK